MIYFVIILHGSTSSTVNVGDVCSRAITKHIELGNKLPNLINEGLCCIAVNDINGLKKIPFTDKDEVRLCLKNEGTIAYSYSKPNHFDIDNIDNTFAIYSYLKEQKVKVNNFVVYI